MIRLVTDPIDVARWTAGPFAGDSGGVVSFVGAVRDSTRGRKVVRLEYEAYPEMAESELAAIVRLAKERFGDVELDVIHRLGVLVPGDVAVVIVARAAHRAAAFDACRFTIDTLKKTVPIWKKEVYDDGEVWIGDRP
jgi:molybdopterin synthase catalytic subunit